MEFRELNKGDLESLIKLYEQLDGTNEGFTVETTRAIWKSEIEGTKILNILARSKTGKSFQLDSA